MVYDRETVAVADSGVARGSKSGWGHPLCSQASRTIGKAILAAYDAAI